MVQETLMIQAQNLSRAYGKKEAVTDISFEVRRGEIFGLLGPNGAGKTTTIRMLTGQINPTSGSARVAASDVVHQQRQLKERIGIVFEEQNLYERLSAYDNLKFSCNLYGISYKRVDEVLELVRLRDRAKDKTHNFSNGMKQRLMIARALLHHPQVLFLDEPGRGLDPIAANEIRRTISALSQEGTTVLLTTHLMDEADSLCQRVAFIVNGRLVANDTPRNLKLNHGKRALKITVASEDSSLQLEDHLLQMDDALDQERLTQWMSQGRIRAMHSTEGTLEDVFIQIAGIQLT